MLCATGCGMGAPCGVNEVKLRHGQIVREGLHTTLTDLRLRKHYRTARERWQPDICSGPAFFIVGRDRAKLGWFWRHAYRGRALWPLSRQRRQSGYGVPSLCWATNGCSLPTSRRCGKAKSSARAERRKTAATSSHGEVRHSPLWQADGQRIRRVAPMEFIGRYLSDWFDYGIGDEVHQLTAGDTAQGNALGTLAACYRPAGGLDGHIVERIRR